MRLWRILRWLSVALAVSACAQNPYHLNTFYLDRFATPNPTLGEFRVCHGFGCAEVSHASLSKDEWRRGAAVFAPPSQDAEAERRRVARGGGPRRPLVGEQTRAAAQQRSHKDMYTLPNLGDPTQLDCIAEAVNTWTSLTLMERGGLLRFHHVVQLSYAGLRDLNTRNTAVLQEKGGDYFAIDPSLVDVGVPPPIMPLATWLGAWPPDPTAFERLDRADATVGQLRP